MRPPEDDTTHFWILASRRTRLQGSVLSYRTAAPDLGLANCLYTVQPGSVDELEHDLASATARSAHVRIIVESDTPSWVEAELLIRGWHLETEYRLTLPAGRRPNASSPEAAVRRASEVDPDWSRRAALFRLDHLEEDARLGRSPRPMAQTDAVIGHRRELERFAAYCCTVHDDEVTGFLCSWPTPQGRGVIEDVYVHPSHRGHRLATAMINYAVAQLRDSGVGDITIAAEVGDTPVQLYTRLGFRPTGVARSYTSS